jgi:CBS domain-containing protein
MTREVQWIAGGSTAYEAAEMMRVCKVSSLLVERRDADDAWGIVTRSDVVQKVVEPGSDPRKVRVHEIMSKPLVLVPPDLNIRYCAQLMERTGVRRLPVFNGSQVVGIITHGDIVRALLGSS